MQAFLPGHFLPHMPQFKGSFLRFAQVVPHTVLPAAHVALHSPSLQVEVPPVTAGHLLPHAPQLLKSV